MTWIYAAFALSVAVSGFLIFWGFTHRGAKKAVFGERLKSLDGTQVNPLTRWHGEVNSRLQTAADHFGKADVKKGKSSMADRLAKADLRMRTSEYFMIQIALVAFVGSVALWRWGLIQALVAMILTFLAPGVYLQYRTRRRLKAFDTQLPQALNILSNGLKAGYSLPQALENVGETLESPSGEEFAKAIREINLGGTLDEALGHLVKRLESADLDLVVTAILIHRNVGGNLAEIMDTIGHTIRERVRIRGEIRTLTAQARLSGLFISIIPIALGVLLYFIAPGYFTPMTSNILGWAMLAAAGVMIFVGNVVMRKFVAIEV
jgi:tight adherence protein B